MEIVLDYAEHHTNLIRAFGAFYDKQEFLDVMFVCKNRKKVLANKLVLSCVSPFLKLMFAELDGCTDMITLLMPEVDHNMLRLVLDFIYEGTMKLSDAEFKEFVVVMKMLHIKLPGASVTKRFLHQSPLKPPPEAAKIQKKSNLLGSPKKSISNTESMLDSGGNHSGTTDETVATDRRTSDPDDDPLNVPDFYFVPSSEPESLQGMDTGAGNLSCQQGSSQSKQKNASKTNSTEPRVEESETNIGNTTSQSGICTRKRSYNQMGSTSSGTDASGIEKDERRTSGRGTFTNINNDSLENKDHPPPRLRTKRI